MAVHGLLLAAGAGTRMGVPKALVRDAAGRPWVERHVGLLRDGGCRSVTVVIGAGAQDARALLADARVDIVEAEDWADGMSASLRAGLATLASRGAEVALVSLVDLPDLTAHVVRRVVAAAGGPATLARATYEGRPGHPVLLGRDHWQRISASAVGDAGARAYLASHEVHLVECGDLATGEDRDRP